MANLKKGIATVWNVGWNCSAWQPEWNVGNISYIYIYIDNTYDATSSVKLKTNQSAWSEEHPKGKGKSGLCQNI